MLGVLASVYEFLTRPSEVYEAYTYLPYHGAILPVLLVNISFVLFVFRIGPWFMRNREPYNLKRILLIYNVTQIIFNLIMVGLSARLILIYYQNRGLACIEPIPYEHPQKSFEIFCGLLYLGNKFLDYSETIFMVLRKSFKQITFLHVYHHIMMTSFVFLYIYTQGSGGHSSTVAMINALVHSIMYIYYLMSSLNENMKKSLWWKKYITQIQLIQFIIDFIHQLWPLVFVPDCRIPKVWSYIALTQATLMIYLFGNFYMKSYIRKPKAKKVAEKQT
ncbi:very long chain fatty acid elongase F-like [Eurosta solidaginis]|uniref:very long chain fatty acid elongase F-like n=1 Tax=Eurosta solidaginis TaxID=178769 RepID=UPI0035307CFF